MVLLSRAWLLAVGLLLGRVAEGLCLSCAAGLPETPALAWA